MFTFLNCYKIRCPLLVLVSTYTIYTISFYYLYYESIKFVALWFVQRYFEFERRHEEVHGERKVQFRINEL